MAMIGYLQIESLAITRRYYITVRTFCTVSVKETTAPGRPLSCGAERPAPGVSHHQPEVIALSIFFLSSSLDCFHARLRALDRSIRQVAKKYAMATR